MEELESGAFHDITKDRLLYTSCSTIVAFCYSKCVLSDRIHYVLLTTWFTNGSPNAEWLRFLFGIFKVFHMLTYMVNCKGEQIEHLFIRFSIYVTQCICVAFLNFTYKYSSTISFLHFSSSFSLTLSIPVTYWFELWQKNKLRSSLIIANIVIKMLV